MTQTTYREDSPLPGIPAAKSFAFIELCEPVKDQSAAGAPPPVFKAFISAWSGRNNRLNQQPLHNREEKRVMKCINALASNMASLNFPSQLRQKLRQKLRPKLLLTFLLAASVQSAFAASQYMAVSRVSSSSGYEIETGQVVDGLGVSEVDTALASSGRLLTFVIDGQIHTADAAGFEEVVNNSAVGSTLLRFDAAGDTARLCLTLFDKQNESYLYPSSPQLENYLRVTQADNPVSFTAVMSREELEEDAVNYQRLRRSESDLCLEGLEYSTNYKVELLSGLELSACSGEGCQPIVLQEGVSFWGATGDRPAAIELVSGKRILPVEGEALIPVQLTNVSSVNIELFEVDLRSITSAGSLFKSISGYEREWLSSEYARSLGSKQVKLEPTLNSTRSVNINLDSLLPNPAKGIYVAVFDSEDLNLREWDTKPTQWLIRSNLSISSYHGRNQTDIFLTAFDSMDPVADAQVQVIAQNNRLLFEGKSDRSGHLSIPGHLLAGQGGHAPAFLLVDGQRQGLGLLQFSAGGGELKTGQKGMAKATDRDIYLTSDRELYRAGDSIQFVLMGRDSKLDALQGIDLKVELVDAYQDVIDKRSISPDQFGLAQSAFDLAANIELGTYEVVVKGMDDVVLARHKVRVEDFVPLTLRAELETQETWSIEEETGLTLSAEYFSGGKAANLDSELVAAIKLSNTHESDALKGYLFGSDKEQPQQYLDTFTGKLSAQGESTYAFSLPQDEFAQSGLYSLSLKGSVFDVGGRPNSVYEQVKVDATGSYLGARPQFSGALEEGENAVFDLIRVNRDGATLPFEQVRYELREVDYSFDWYFDNGWRYRSKRQGDRVVTAGETSDHRLVLTDSLDWGSYELVVVDSTGFTTVVPFSVGWYGDTPVSEPGQLELSVEAKDDEELLLKLDAPFSGTLRVMQASADIEDYRLLDVKQGANEFSVPREVDAEPGFHLLATLVRPVARGSEHLPQIAMGSAWIDHLAEGRLLDTEVEVAETQRSSQPTTIRVRVNSDAGKGMIFLVDEGIHAISRYRNADPREFFFGQRKLSLGFLSNFGQLIQQDQQLQAYGVGGDQGESDPGVLRSDFFKTVTQHSPLLDIEQGVMEYTFDAPDFEGEMRAVVLVVSDQGVGFEQAQIRVQDPVSIDVSLPRFVGVGDRIAGKLGLRVNEPRDELTLDLQVGEDSTTSTLASPAEGQRLNQALPLHSALAGAIPVQIDLSANDQSVRRDYSIQARETSYPLAQMRSIQLPQSAAQDGRFEIAPMDLSGFANPETTAIQWSLSTRPGASLRQAVAALDRYPYGCVEQVSSGTRGLLAIASLNAADSRLERKINRGIDAILAKQKANGSFGYWDRDDRVEERYQAYAAETLLDAMPYASNPEAAKAALDRALTYLDRQFVEDAWTALYTYGVLAKAGYEVTSRARYAIDEQLPAALAQQNDPRQRMDLLLAAYWSAAQIQDDKRAERLLTELSAASDALVSRSEQQTPAQRWFDPLIAEAGTESESRPWITTSGIMLATIPPAYRTALTDSLSNRAIQGLSELRYRSTLNNAHLAALTEGADRSDALNIRVNGEPIGADLAIPAELAVQGFSLEHDASETLFLNAEIIGPRSSSQALRNGLKVEKFWVDDSGSILSRNQSLSLEQGESVNVVVHVRADKELGNGNLMLTDLLPSGFELEADSGIEPRIELAAGKVELLSNLRAARPTWEQRMDDRYVANFDLSWSEGRSALIHYRVRAAYPGTMQLPDAHAEFMYRAEVNGRSSVGEAQILEK
ncbi:hypothetical protein CLV83_0444 [Marinobacterium mangrovicola]|uniref:Alpha-2-macroglobulin family protein n=2 Tax=Marinobacterium mangrovicola TaxID=1476959 RepID=A0A4R1GNC9_9GAMM|nr:hypothetical protein CLV83_0444 [Marinobacterium mangrovicola]